MPAPLDVSRLVDPDYVAWCMEAGLIARLPLEHIERLHGPDFDMLAARAYGGHAQGVQEIIHKGERRMMRIRNVTFALAAFQLALFVAFQVFVAP